MNSVFTFRKILSMRCGFNISGNKKAASLLRPGLTYCNCLKKLNRNFTNLCGQQIQCASKGTLKCGFRWRSRIGFILSSEINRGLGSAPINNGKFSFLKYRKYLISSIVAATGTLLLVFYYKGNVLFHGFGNKESNMGDVASAYSAEPDEALIKLPDHVQYLLIGGGTASFSAFRAIKGKDPDAEILVIAEENNYPYMRPPLSKELWFTNKDDVTSTFRFKAWSGKERDLFYEKREFFIDPEKLKEREHGGVSIVRGRKVVKLDIPAHVAILQDGTKIKYQKCLIATGGTPKNLKEILDGGSEVMERTTVYRKADDFKKLYEISHGAQSVAIVGGGFLGSELAVALARHAKSAALKITQLFPESGILAKILPEYLSEYATCIIKNEGVSVMPNAKVEKVSFDGNKVNLQLQDGKNVNADHVVVAVGIDPNIELAKSSGLEIDPENGGFICDAELRARTDVWVAGDCCSFYDVKLGRRRVEHHDHAIISGRLAGENMAGAAKPYLHQSMFWSDLGPEFGCEALGLIDSSLPTVGVFAKAAEEEEKHGQMNGESSQLKMQAVNASANGVASEIDEPNHNFDKGVVFYTRDKKIVGILLWNVFNRIPIARKILKENIEFDDLNEVAKLFNIHDSSPVGQTESVAETASTDALSTTSEPKNIAKSH